MKSIFLKLIIFTVIHSITSITAYSQQNEWKKHQIKLSPLRSINFFSPGLELSYELNYGQFSTQLSVAYLTDIFNIVPRSSNFEGYRFNLEEKYFLKAYSNSKRRSYLSAKIGYNQIDMTVYSEFIPSEYLNESWQIQEENVYWDYCDMNRKSIIGNLKYGMQFLFNHYTLDMALGIGITHQNVKHFNKRNSEDKLTRTEPEDILTPLFYDEGKYFIFNFPLSFKIGIAF